MSPAEGWRIESAKTSSILAYERLKRAISSGEFQPGERLTETRIASMLGVSRTPVRDAFARLVMDGLLAQGANGGVTIVDPRAEFAEIYHIREAIEGCAARLAATEGTAEEKKHIGRLAAASRAVDPNDLKARARINEAFHLAIAAAAHAPRVERLVTDYQALFASPLILQNYSPRDTVAALAAHGQIADAIRDGNGDAAEIAMRAHLHASYAFALKRSRAPRKPALPKVATG